MRKFWYLYVTILSFPIFGEMHRLWSDYYLEITPFLCSDQKIDIEWFVKDVGNIFQFICVSYTAFRLSKYVPYIGGEGKAALKGIYFYCILDMIFYLINFKQGYYALVYYILIIILIKAKIFK